MNKDYRYILEKGSKKHLCPDCGKKSFVRYIDTETKQYLPEHYGRCDHETSCNYYERPPLETRCFFVPFIQLIDYSNKAYKLENKEGKYFLPKSQVYEIIEKGCYVSEYVLTNEMKKAPLHISTDCKYYSEAGTITIVNHEKKPKPQPQPVYFLPEEILNATLKDYDKNIFVQNLLKLAPIEDIEKVISLYRIGTIGSGEREGAVTFPFIDRAGNIRTIQAKQFNETNHTISTDFVHSIISRFHTQKGEVLPGWLNEYTKNERFVSCLFGEHLLNKYPLNPVALVEAPKTAIIGTLYYGLPETAGALLWLAVYNKSSLTLDKCKALQGRKVALFPDLNAFNEWNTKTQELKIKLPGTRFICSDILEKEATETERAGGLDLADYLLRFDYKLFRKQPEQVAPKQKENTPQGSQYNHSEPIKHPEPEQAPSPATKPEQLPEPITKSEKGEKHENETKHYFEQKTASFKKQPENWITEIELLEAFFNETSLPQTPLNLSQCETITDLPKFILSHLTTVKRYNGNPTFKPHLQRLKILKENLN